MYGGRLWVRIKHTILVVTCMYVRNRNGGMEHRAGVPSSLHDRVCWIRARRRCTDLHGLCATGHHGGECNMQIKFRFSLAMITTIIMVRSGLGACAYTYRGAECTRRYVRHNAYAL